MARVSFMFRVRPWVMASVRVRVSVRVGLGLGYG